MPRFLIDSSCIVAQVSSWHEHHDAAFEEVERRMDSGHELVLAAHSLAESYSVLTRLPPSQRISPEAAAKVLIDSYGDCELIALDAEAYRLLVQRAPSFGVSGGRIYDSIILACALAAGAETLITFNRRDFLPLAGEQLEIVVPGQGAST